MCVCVNVYCVYMCACVWMHMCASMCVNARVCVNCMHVCVFCVRITVKVHVYGLVWRSEVSLMYSSTELHLTNFEVESLIGLELSKKARVNSQEP